MTISLIRLALTRVLLALTVPAFVCLAACGKDPQVAKREFVKSGDDYMAQGKYSEAVIQYRNAVQQDPLFGEARSKLSAAQVKTGDLAGAYQQAIRAADLLSNDVKAQLTAATLLLKVQRFDDAKVRAEKALEKEPRNVEALIARASALAGLQKLDDAVIDIEKAIQNQPDRADPYTALGTVDFVRGDKRASEAAFRRAVEVDPKSINAHLALAQFFWASRDLSGAEQEFKAALDLDPKSQIANRAMVLFLLGSKRRKEVEPYLQALLANATSDEVRLAVADEYLGLQKRDVSKQILEAIAQKDSPAAIGAKVRLAGMGVAAGDPKAAMRMLDEILAKTPGEPQALLAKGVMQSRSGDLKEAAKTLRLAATANPGSGQAQFLLGQALLTQQDRAGAAAAFKEAVRLDPGLGPAEVALARLSLADGDLAAALAYAKSAVDKVHGYVEARVLLTRLYLLRGDVKEAEAMLRPIAAIVADRPDIQLELGHLEQYKKNRSAARTAYERAQKMAPKSLEPLTGLLSLDFEEGKTAAAADRLKKALNESPDNAELLVIAANAQFAMGDLKAAEASARRAIERDPNAAEAYSLLAKVHVQTGKLDEAIAELEKLGEQRPKSAGIQTAIGSLLALQKKSAEAKQRYERALAIDPQAALAANNLAWIYAQSGTQLDLALDLAKTAKSQLPDNATVSDTLGWVYYKKGLWSPAISALADAVRLAPKDAKYHYHLGMAYAGLGDAPNARTSLQKALTIDPNFDGATDARQKVDALK